MVPSDRTKGNDHKLKHKKFHLNIQKHFFTARVVQHWSRLPKEAVEFPSLEIFRIPLAMSKLLSLTLL